MKTIKLKYVISLLIGVFIIFSSCEDFLIQLPKDKIVDEDFWKYPQDFKFYVNQFYPSLSSTIVPDVLGDEALYQAVFSDKLEGRVTVPASGGGWSFSNIRSVNYLFEQFKEENLEKPLAEYNQYLGEAYFFRAYFYFNLVKKFGDIPYFHEVLNMNSEELFSPRTPRQQVIDYIIADLDKAIEYMISIPNEEGMRLNKAVAELFKSRVCLYEGTWEKYHNATVFGVLNPKINVYLELAADAALDLIESSQYSLYTTGNPKTDYNDLFNRVYYSDNSEVLLWEKFDTELGKTNARAREYASWGFQNFGMTKEFIGDYLCSDGLPSAVSPLYQGDNVLTAVMANRDPRLNQSVWEPGAPYLIEPYPTGDTTIVFERSFLGPWNRTCPTGYQWRKGYRPDDLQRPYGEGYLSYTGSIHFRLTEALLNYAEAKAELGIIIQADIDMTINKLRDRVGMPHFDINNISNDPNWLFPNLSPIINEIRRERRVELAGEGFRWADLTRWRAHTLFVGKRYLGAKFDPVMYPELVGQKSLLLDADGYIDPLQMRLPQGYGFNPDRDYLDPIPTKELTLNKYLVQNPGW